MFTVDQRLVPWSDKQLCEVSVYFTGDQSLVSLSDKQLCEVLLCLQVIRVLYPILINNILRFWYILQVFRA